MAKIQVDNVLKIIDVQAAQLNHKTILFLKERGETYQDKTLKEHIYNILDILEAAETEEINPDILGDLWQLSQLQDKKGAGYTRIIYS